ncbi:S-layer homology domain-containing protein [Paenibacillus radicis (ex Xue et al. 2023)]|uniref:S-layer homology domain-containing protein n=1 Tax=Paenibacillus radicis (ex Xue et al. 2023) TaxID=2972489 RepID=A0ABT1YDF6_9BACL|nr:S-layer homology domain-containing protein [Paenibacillus radicis (ex Xue et al. 2023)]MCR8631234.1 S-layer homology domain-containing protein [Paenibacillus radicis (ex Xue et al. 2023)]
MFGLINKNKRWYSLALIVMMLVTMILPNAGVQKVFAAPEIVAGWTFSTAATSPVAIAATSGTNANLTNALFTVSGERGVSYTASDATVYTSGWQTVGGYWQAQLSTKGYSQLTLTSKHFGTGTGPKDFKIQYSTDGTTFNDVPNGSYVNTATITAGPDNLALPSEVNDKPTVYIRWLNYTTNPISSGTATGSGGNSRIAGIVINGVKMGQSQSAAPNANKISFNTLTNVSSVSGAVYGGANVKVYLADNSVAGTGAADTNGAFNITINNPNSERKVYITSLESGKTESSKVSVDFGAIPKTNNPDASKITLFDDYTTLKGAPGAVYGLAAVKVYLPDNTLAGTTNALSDGSFNLTIGNTAHSTSVLVSAMASGNDESDKVTVSIQKTLKPDASKIAFTKSTSVTGSAGAAANNAQISVYFDDNTVAGTTAATANGSFNLTITNPGGKNAVYVTSKETGKIESDKTTVNVSVPGASYSPGDVVLSQLYVNGGNGGAFYKTKFFELYNTTNQDINFNNEWALIYTSATGTSFGAGSKLNGTIKAHGYFLVAGSTGGTGANLPVTADLTTTINPSGSTGGIFALANSITGLSSQDDSKAIDIVAFGNGTTTSFATKTDHWGSPIYNTGIGGGTLLRRTNTGSDPRIAFGLGNGWFTKDPSKDFVINAPSSPSQPDEVIIHNSKFMTSPDSTLITFTQASGTASVSGAANAVPASATVKVYLYNGETVSSVQQATAAANGSFSLSFSNPGNNQSIYVTHTDSTEPTPVESKYSRVNVTGYPNAVTPIDQLRINDVNGFPLNLGYAATIEGVATSNNNALGAEKTHFYIQDATGGINIIDGKAPVTAIQAGNKFKIDGHVVFTAGTTRFVPTTITHVGPDQTPAPQLISLNSMNSYATAEPLEGKLVTISGTVTNIPSSGPDYDISITDDAGNLSIVRILGTSGIDVSNGAIEQGGTYAFTGIVGQSKNSSPFKSGYYVLPRSASDVKGELQFTHTPLVKAYIGIDVSFTAAAKNADSVTLYYKGTADSTFNPIIMSSADGKSYNGKIPQASMPAGKLLYYIEAKGNGKTLSSGDFNNPISIDVVEDKDGPAYTNASPANGESVDTGHPVISVALDDPNGVNTSSVSIKIDGNDFTSKAAISEKDIKLALTSDNDLSVGVHTVAVSAKDKLGNLSAYSWSFEVLQRFIGGNHYRGTTHNHTNISHDADGAPEDALKAAEKYQYDWFAFSDHSHDIDSSLVGKDSVDHNGMKERSGGANWQLTKDLANRYTKNGSFVVFPAFEMTSTTWGHSNVFGTSNFIDRVEEGGTYQDLKNYYSWVLTYDNIVAQFNHPAMSANAFANFIPYDKKVDKLFTMLEVGNGSGKYSYANAQDKFFNALDLGWHVAPTYGEDNHDATWGQTKNRTVIVANDLSQESLLDAMRKMRVYMSEDPNFKLDVLASGYYMGSTVDTKTLEFNITGSDPVLEASSDPKYSYLKTTSNDNISKVELITNGGRVVDSYIPTSDSTSFNWKPSFTVLGGQQWFVVRVTQKDGDRIYSSPIWSPNQDLAVQVSNVDATEGAIIGGLPADLKAGISNQGSINVSNLVAHFYYDSIDSQHFIGDATIDSLPANTSGSASVKWSNPVVGEHKVIIVLEAKDGHDLGNNKFEQQFTIKAPLGKIILIDATHQNENTTLDAGSYKDNLKLFTVMMRKQGYTVLENTAQITDQVLSNVNVLMVTHPASAYTTNEVSTINKFISNGGSLLLTEKSNFGGSNQNANSLLSGIGSSIQVNNDGVFDETKEGNFWSTPLTSNFSVRLHPTPVNNNLTDFVPTIEYYSGASLAGIGGAGNKVALKDSSSVTVLVRGNESTFQDTPSVKSDAVPYNVFTANGKNGPPLDSITGGTAIPLIASETIGNSRIIVTGMNIFNDKQMDETYNPKGNDPFALNAINWLSHLESKVLPIGEARTKPEGTEAIIQGKVTTTAFYDAVYVQDETGGIMAFNEVPAGSLAVGDTVRIYGHIKIFENNTELEFDKFSNSIVKLNTSPGAPVVPKAVSTLEAYAEANQGQLVKVTGKVTEIPDGNSYIINDGSGAVLVFADGYIINQTGPIPKLQKGDTLEAVGLTGKYADGKRVRVRDTRELKALSLSGRTAAEVAAEITAVAAPAKDATSITLPSVPAGYTIAIKTSSHPEVIATNGTIVPQGTETIVNLVFTITRTSDNTTADTASLAVIVPATTNVNLKSLQLSGATINFSKDKSEYTLSVGNNVSSVSVTAAADDSTAILEINGDTASSKEFNLSEGLNTITVKVTAKDGTARKIYTLLITRAVSITVTNTPVQVTTEPVSLIIPSGVTNAKVQVTPTTVGDTKQATMPLVEAKETTSIGEVSLSLPSGVTISAPAAWDGTIKLPEVLSNNSVAATNGIVSAVIEVGVPELTLTFDKAVRLLIPNQAGKSAGFVRDGVIAPITNTLTADTQEEADSKLSAGGEAKIDVGNDLVIWTKHFTKFVSYTESQPTSSSGSHRGGGASAVNTDMISAAVGGTIINNGVKIAIPADAINSDIKVTVEKVTNTADLATDATLKLVSDIFEIKKDKENPFTKAISISLPFDKTKVDTEKSKLSIYWLDETERKWTSLDSPQVDIVNGVVTGSVNHLTKFAVFSTNIQDASTSTPTKPASLDLTDIKGHWAENSIRELIKAGAIDGYPNGTFGPERNITRAEFAAAMVKALGLKEKSGKIFADTANHWAKKSIETAAAYEIISGFSDNSFGPDDLITREQMAAMVVRAAKLPMMTSGTKFTDSSDISEWAKLEVDAAAANGTVNGYANGTFKPKANATRAEAVTVILKAIKK